MNNMKPIGNGNVKQTHAKPVNIDKHEYDSKHIDTIINTVSNRTYVECLDEL